MRYADLFEKFLKGTLTTEERAELVQARQGAARIWPGELGADNSPNIVLPIIREPEQIDGRLVVEWANGRYHARIEGGEWASVSPERLQATIHYWYGYSLRIASCPFAVVGVTQYPTGFVIEEFSLVEERNFEQLNHRS